MKQQFTKLWLLLLFVSISTTGLFAQLSGNYTIGAGTSYNYSTPAAAASALSSVGVSGPVTFSIANGTYSGQVSFGAIKGASATNTITFIGASKDSAKVVITNSSTYTIYMASASYVNFEYVTITTTYTSGYCIYMNASSYNTFSHVKMSGGYYGAYVYYSFYASFDNCHISKSSQYGFYFYNTSTDFGKHNNVTNSTVHNVLNYGIYYYYQRDGLIDKVDVDSTNYGLYSYYGNNNTITNSRFKCNYYHYVAYQNYSGAKSGDTTKIVNNQFINLGASSYGIYGYYGYKVKWYHNSFDLSGTTYGMYWYNPTGCEIINNNIEMDASSYGFYMYSTPAKMDYNNMHLTASTYCYFGTSTHSSLAALKSAYSAFNQNSFDTDPGFNDPENDLNTSSAVLNNKGYRLNNPLTRLDCNGNKRPQVKDAPKVDIGCNEYYLDPYDLNVFALVSPLSVDLKTNKITAQFKNGGSQAITKTVVYPQYSVDSGKTWITDTLAISSLDPGKVIQFDYTVPWKPTRSGKFRVSIKVVDKTLGTDQKDYEVCSGLSGSYTIGKRANADYHSFNDALKGLGCGIAGPLVFNVQGGIYTENLNMGVLLGASATNTITFRSPSRDSVVLRSTSGNTITLNGTDYVSFENIQIKMDGSSGYTLCFTNQADHNRFSNCLIYNNVSVTSTAANPIVFSGSTTSYSTSGNNGNYNVFEDNDIQGGYFGIVMYGNGSTSPIVGNEFLRNTITKAYYYGAYIYYHDGIVFHDNVIKDFRNTYNYGMMFYYHSNFDIQRNYTNTVYYNALYYANYYSYNGKTRSIFANNMMISTGTSYALYGYQMTNTNFWHNSIYGKGTYLVYWYYMTDNDIRNNIFYYEGSTYCIYTYNPTFVEWDYNDYVIKGGNLAYITGTIISNVSALKAWNPNYNQNNFEEDPEWVDKNDDLHLTKKFPGLYGANVGVTLDHDQDKRCAFAPTIGADEFSQSSLPPTANFLVPDTAWLGSPTILLNSNKASRVLGAKWYVNGKFVSDSIHLEYTPKNIGLDTITLVMENCSGSDTKTQYVFVSPILRAPKVDFSATSRDVYTNEILTLLDLSENGTTQWLWDIKPKVIYDPFLLLWSRTYFYLGGTDSTSANPHIEFGYPGIYEVKLSVANSFGRDSLVRTAYITVRQKAVMCDINSQTSGRYGTLYDDGGEFGSYSAGLNGLNKCTYLIADCYGEVNLSLSQFELGDDDYLKIYDGEDNSGRPLWDIANFPDGMTGSKTDKSVMLNLVAKSGSAYFVFESDNNTATTGKGFAINWEMNATAWTAPSAAISAPDTVCVGFPSVLSNASTGNYSDIEWDVNNDGRIDYTGEELSYTFTTPGTYTIWLHTTSLCAPSDSTSKRIVAESAWKAPKPNFTANHTIVSAGDTVRINSTSSYCASATAWTITPSTFILANDAELTDEYIDVVFVKGGYYTIEVEKSNPYGKDSVEKINYIQVLDYCLPSVSNLDADVAISRVAFGSINNASSVGKTAYSNYLHLSTDVERGNTYEIVVERATNNKALSRKVWIDWNVDGDFDDVGELVAEELASTNMVFKDSITIDPSAKAGETRMRISVNYKNLKNVACGPHQFGEFEDYTINIIEEDKTAPTLVLSGAMVDTIEVNSTWTEPGYYAYDKVDGLLTKDVVVNNGLDNTTVGSYTIKYTVQDKSGNSSTAERIIYVLDRTDPTISLNGKDTVYVLIHTTYTEDGTNQSDNYDKSLSVNIFGNVDTASLGEYTVNYCVQDASGNGPVCTSRLVIVYDDIDPTISLIGNDKEVVEVFSFYSDAGYTVSDNDGYTVATSGTWDGEADSLGTFTLIYTVTDNAGNMATVTREIEVVDTKAPIVEMNGNWIDTVARWSDYVDAGVTFSDNYYDNADLVLVEGGTFENTQSEGVYYKNYQVTDPSSNESVVMTRLIVVIEDLNGTGIAELEKGVFKAFPNPSNGIFNVSAKGFKASSAQLRVLDLAGKEIYQNRNYVISNGQFSVDLSALSAGTYYIQISNEATQVVEKIVITK